MLKQMKELNTDLGDKAEKDGDTSVLDFLQKSDNQFHSAVFDAFYKWKEDMT